MDASKILYLVLLQSIYKALFAWLLLLVIVANMAVAWQDYFASFVECEKMDFFDSESEEKSEQKEKNQKDADEKICYYAPSQTVTCITERVKTFHYHHVLTYQCRKIISPPPDFVF